MPGRRAVLAALLAVGLPGCAGDRALAAEVEAAVEAELRRRPEQYVNGEARAWSVRRDGVERGTLWGTVHLPYSGDLVMPRPVRARFNASASLTIEDFMLPAQVRVYQRQRIRAWTAAKPAAVQALDPGTRAAMRSAGLREEDEAKVSLLGLSLLALARNAPAAATVSSLPSAGIVDFTLARFARSVRIPVGALEALGEWPDPALLDPNGPPGASALRLALRRLGTGAALRDVTLAYYSRGDVARVLAAGAAWRAMPDDLAAWEEHCRMMLTARNQAWMAPLERVLAGGGTHFVAFGCAHLPGTDGVVALLRNRGWDVQPCLGDACA